MDSIKVRPLKVQASHITKESHEVSNLCSLAVNFEELPEESHDVE